MKNTTPDKKKVILIRKFSYLASSALFIILLMGLVIFSFDFAHRETFSESEKRELAKFPEFSISSFFSGEYFDGINLWFSDTFPFRDDFVATSVRIKKLLGAGQNIHHFSENTGDAIPESESEEYESILDIAPVVPDQNINEDIVIPAAPTVNNGSTTSSKAEEHDDNLEQKFDAIYIYGDTGYEYYNFIQSAADKYVSAINSAATSAAANAINFYNMLVPTSIDITLNESSRSKLNSSDQKEAIKYMYSSMNSNVKKVQVFDLLKAHKDEYLYFRTDHHWTSIGAYYAYAQLMSVKGVNYEPLTNFTQYAFPGFLGSFYNDTGKNAALEANPDILYAYMPKYDISFSMMQKGDSQYTLWPLISDGATYSASYKYLCFIGGDNPISIIENNSMTDGEICVFVKESFGNAFAPYLACNYKKVYVIDYRYFDSDITDFAKEKGATDIVVQNNISMTRNASLVNRLAEVL